MAETIMTPVLLREKVAQYRKGRTYLSEYACPICGKVVLKVPCMAKVNPCCNSCGQSKHGLGRRGGNRDPRYRVWASMKKRTENPNDRNYRDYGGRGITLCKEWLTFDGFMAWDKFDQWKPGLQIDRIDNNLGYSPENCHWATCSENVRNRRISKLRNGDIHAIRMLCWSGLSRAAVGRIFGVSTSMICTVMSFKTWGDV